MNAWESLLQKNPFTSSCASDPWSESHPHVESINKSVLECILSLIQEKTDSPKKPLSAMVLGNAGMGKTHFLRRILDGVKRENIRCSFVFVETILNPKTPFRRLLNEIILNLDKKIDSKEDDTQLDHLLADIKREYITESLEKSPVLMEQVPANRTLYEEIQNDPLHTLNVRLSKEALRRIIPWLQKKIPQDKTFLKVLFQYDETKLRTTARDWLRGEPLAPEDCRELNVPDRPFDNDPALEEESRRILMTLGELFTHYQRSMVVCFDQLDALREQNLILAYGDMIHLLVNDTAAILPVSLIQLAYWQNMFVPVLQQTVQDRLLMNKFLLSDCSLEQASQLIESRIQLFHDDPKPLTQWMLEQLQGRLTAGISPRRVIQIANETLLEKSGVRQSASPQITESESFQELYQLEAERISSEWSSRLPDTEQLREALAVFLCQQPFREVKITGEEARFFSPYLIPHGLWKNTDGSEVPCAFLVKAENHHLAVGAALDRGVAFLEKNPSQKKRCFFISDERSKPFRESWVKTNQQRQKFERLGGVVILLDKPEVIRWLALLSLRNMTREGNVQIDGRTATDRDFDMFLKNDFSPPLIDLRTEPVSTPKTKTVSPEEPPSEKLPKNLAAVIEEILDTFPMHSVTVPHLQEQLNGRGIALDRETLLQFLGDNKHRFMMFPLQNSHAVTKK
ncbi:MAG: hypothetical protein LBQ54_02755 [Planctomycetaceae bacterium]|jgi:Cdc6-like AAA superfamily ATPase|nr:hypothetical protein [Planctomycetaceae bacterium]